MTEASPAGSARAGEALLNFSRIPTVLSADELIDKAFKRASNVTVMNQDRFQRFKATESARVRSAQNNIQATLTKYVAKFPSFDQLPPFYRDLIGLLADVDRARKALGALDWAAKQVEKVGNETVAAIKSARREDAVLAAKKKAFGRFSSFVKQVGGDLDYLNAVRDAIRRLPMIDPSAPTIVVAGYPNVGKSSLIRKISTAEPEVAAYPFTTKGIAIGIFEKRRIRYQVVDTPGLLDRDFEARNAIEKQAVLALQHLADCVVFVLDPSETCGYPIAAQERLLADTRALFPEAPILVVENKVDLERREAIGGRLQMSTETGEGIDEVVNLAVKSLRSR